MATAEQLITENLDVWTSAVQGKSAARRGTANKLELYGIKKLRELILELAVRGLLVPQDPNDQPASELLKKIASEKVQLLKDGKIKKQSALSEIEDGEQPFDLAQGWEWVRLGEIASVIRGVTYKKVDASDVEVTGTVPLMRANNIGRGLNFDGLIYIPADLVKPEQLIVEGDVLIAMSSGSADLVGKAAQAKEELQKTFGAFCGVIRAFSPALFAYFDFFFQTPLYRKQTRESGKGIGIQNLNHGSLSALLVPVPPAEEGRKLIAKVDELMALCDQLEQQQEASITAHQTLVQTLLDALTTASERDDFTTAWARIADHFDTLFTTEWSIEQLKQTIMQLAVMGKLAPQDPNDEPASELLKKISVEKAQQVKDGRIKKQKILPAIEEDEKPFELPKGWEWARIGEISLTTDYGLSEKSSAGEVGIPVLAMGHIQSGEIILGGQKVVPESVNSLPELYLENRDLLYNRTNSAELVGKTGIYLGNDNEYTFASYLIRIRIMKNTRLPEFINLNMQTPKFRATQIEPHLKQQCGQANVNGTIMKNMLVAVAPQAEIARILDTLETLLGFCGLLKANLTRAQNTQLLLAEAATSHA